MNDSLTKAKNEMHRTKYMNREEEKGIPEKVTFSTVSLITKKGFHGENMKFIHHQFNFIIF